MPDPSFALDMVQRDVTEGLSEVLAAEDGEHGFRLLDGFEAVSERPIGDFVAREGVDQPEATIIAVPWIWTGVHVGPLLGVPATNRRLVIRGVTLVQDQPDVDGNPVTLHRYVDWAATLEELGARIYTRPVVDVRDRAGERFLDVEHFKHLVDEGLLPG